MAADSGTIYIPQIVQVETIWVLESAYRFSRETVSTVLNAVAGNAAYVVQRRDVFTEALRQCGASAADFSDCLILAEAGAEKTQLATFDKKLSKLAGAKTKRCPKTKRVE